MNIEDKDKEKFIKGVHLFVMSKQNLLFHPGTDGFTRFMNYHKEGVIYFNENFPDITKEELTEIMDKCFEIYSHLTNTSIMHLYTGSREVWGYFLNKSEN